MTPKEKAIELVNKFIPPSLDRGADYYISEKIAKQCALITVDEILDVIDFYKYDDKYWEEEEYLKEVKQEIEKL